VLLRVDAGHGREQMELFVDLSRHASRLLQGDHLRPTSSPGTTPTSNTRVREAR
jgi:hypothetical protein